MADTIASGANDASTGTDAGTVAGSDDAGAAPAAQVDGQYEVGDTYTDGEFDAVYLGLAEIPLGPDIWPDGACYAPIFELTYLDPYDYGTDQFRPSIDGYLTDGRVADDDDTGVGCDAKVFLGFGYERGLDTTLAKGETVKIYGTPFRVAAADIGMLDAVTLFGGPPETGLVPEVTLDLTS